VSPALPIQQQERSVLHFCFTDSWVSCLHSLTF
jgi:hypothetical protein